MAIRGVERRPVRLPCTCQICQPARILPLQVSSLTHTRARPRARRGFLWYLLYVRHSLGTWTSPRSSLWVAHYWGPYKPWREGGLKSPSSVAHYLRQRLGANETNTSRCVGALLDLRNKGIAIHDSRRRNSSASASGVGGFLALAAKAYKNIEFQPLLPYAV